MSENATIQAGNSAARTIPFSKVRLWTGRLMSTLAVLFLLMDGVMKLVKPSFIVQATVQLGYSESVIVGLGIVLLTCTILYVIPPTNVLGAILLTGYLGGAVATHVRIGHPLLSHTLFPVYVLCWFGAGFSCATHGCAQFFLFGKEIYEKAKIAADNKPGTGVARLGGRV